MSFNFNSFVKIADKMKNKKLQLFHVIRMCLRTGRVRNLQACGLFPARYPAIRGHLIFNF